MTSCLSTAHKMALRELGAGHVAFDAPLAGYCTWRIGGPADALIEPSSPEEIQRLLLWVRNAGLPLVVIGQGSNLLFADAGLRGIVLRLGPRFSRITIDGEHIVADGGAWVPGLARRAQQSGLAGLEHIIGIPGTIGGLAAMNGGSRRRAIGENLAHVELIRFDGTPQRLAAAACGFAYRKSGLQGAGVITRVELLCFRGDARTIRREMLADLRERRSKFPLRLPNCGSVFLSTASMHATVGPPGRIIEESGLKGLRVGGAVVSQQHANFIVNTGGATACDVLTLIEGIRRRVRERIGFELECEVRFVAADGTIHPAHAACTMS